MANQGAGRRAVLETLATIDHSVECALGTDPYLREVLISFDLMAIPPIESVIGELGFLGDFHMRAASTPHAIAMIEPGRESFTFDGVRNRIQRMACAVSNAGVTRQDVVAVVLPDGARVDDELSWRRLGCQLRPYQSSITQGGDRIRIGRP
jgi:hypothetical protein